MSTESAYNLDIIGNIVCKAAEYLQALDLADRKGGAHSLTKYATCNLRKAAFDRRLVSLGAIRCDIDSILAGPFHPLANFAPVDYTRRASELASEPASQPARPSLKLNILLVDERPFNTEEESRKLIGA